MIITHKVDMDLARPWPIAALNVMQDDQYSRNIEFTLTENDAAWEIPDGTTALIRFYKYADKTGGNYTLLPDGTTAYTISGNVVTVALAPQVCTAPGKVELSVCLINGAAQLHTFTIPINVERNPGLVTQSENYFKIAGALADSGWAANMYLVTNSAGQVIAADGPAARLLPEVSEEDNGKILQVVAGAWALADAPAGNVASYTGEVEVE